MNHILSALILCLLTGPAGGQLATMDVVRTASPTERGLAESDFPRVQKIGDGVYTFGALTGSADDRYTTNSMFVVTDDGVLVADDQGSIEDTARLVAAINKITDRPITHVIICSDHGDHTNGNSAFPNGAEFIAHRNSLPALTKAAETGGLLPNTIVDEELDLSVGGHTIRVLFLGRAHTGGDLLVFLPDEKILFATEIFLNHMFSGYRSAFPGEWLLTMDRAEGLEPYMFIPGHGFVDAADTLREEWFAHKDHLQVVYDEVSRLHRSGRSVEEAIEQSNFGKYGNWSGAGTQGPIGIRRIYAELDGELR